MLVRGLSQGKFEDPSVGHFWWRSRSSGSNSGVWCVSIYYFLPPNLLLRHLLHTRVVVMFVLSWKNCGASNYSSIEYVRDMTFFSAFLGFRMARMSTFLRSLIHFRWVTTKEYDRIMAVRRFWFDLFEKLHFSSEKVNFNLKNFDLFHTGIKNIDGSLYKIASNCLNVFYYVLYITFQAYLFALQKKRIFFSCDIIA